MPAVETFLLLAALSAGGDTVLLDFTSRHCGPCQTMEPVVRRLAEAGVPVRQIDVDRERDLATQFRVTGVPCFVLLSGGREVDRVVGATSFDRLAQMFEKVQAAPVRAEAQQVRGQSPDGGARRNGPDLLTRLADRESARAEERSATLNEGRAAFNGGAASVRERALEATVRLKIDEGKSTSFGTGTIIDTHEDEALVLTCGHIFRDSAGKGPITVELCGSRAPEALAGHLIAYDLKRDVALVSIRPGRGAEAMQVAPPSYAPQRGERVFSLGCDHGKEARLLESRVTAVGKYMGPANVEISGAPAVGRSGGGLFSEDGLLIGVCNAADPADNEGIFAALPSVHWQLAQIGQTAIFERAEMALARERAAQPLVEDLADRREAAPPPRMSDEMPPPRKTAPDRREIESSGGSPGDDTEVIFIVRSKTNPRAPGETFVLDRPSPEFLERLSQEYLAAGSRGPSAAETASRPAAPRNSVRAQSADR